MASLGNTELINKFKKTPHIPTSWGNYQDPFYKQGLTVIRTRICIQTCVCPTGKFSRPFHSAIFQTHINIDVHVVSTPDNEMAMISKFTSKGNKEVLSWYIMEVVDISVQCRVLHIQSVQKPASGLVFSCYTHIKEIWHLACDQIYNPLYCQLHKGTHQSYIYTYLVDEDMLLPQTYHNNYFVQGEMH